MARSWITRIPATPGVTWCRQAYHRLGLNRRDVVGGPVSLTRLWTAPHDNRDTTATVLSSEPCSSVSLNYRTTVEPTNRKKQPTTSFSVCHPRLSRRQLTFNTNILINTLCSSVLAQGEEEVVVVHWHARSQALPALSARQIVPAGTSCVDLPINGSAPRSPARADPHQRLD